MPLVALLPACATLQDTPAQQRSWAAFKQCESSFPGVRITRVEPDGRTWFSYESPAALAAMRACADQRRAQNARTGQAATSGALAHGESDESNHWACDRWTRPDAACPAELERTSKPDRE
jgi:hypothetical protein